MNKVIILGAITRDIELKHTQQGKAIANFGIAHNETYIQNGERKQKTMFIDCVAFDRGAEIIQQYFKKGSRILIEGKLILETWQGKDGQERRAHKLAVERVDFIDKREQETTAPAQPAPSYNQRLAQSHSQPAPTISIDDDSIPF